MDLSSFSRSWNLCLYDEIRKSDFIKNKEEACVFRKGSGSIIIFLVL